MRDKPYFKASGSGPVITHRGVALRACVQIQRGRICTGASRACILSLLGVYSSHDKRCIRFRRTARRRATPH
jgi:hypothetical protein